jgi:hypothetical protein
VKADEMRVLVGCEVSGQVRDAFASMGHDSWSCDVQASHAPGNHIQGDVLDILNDGWDLAIFHPPCTYMCNAGMARINEPGRRAKRDEAFEFFMRLVNAPVEHICIENPAGYPNTAYRKPDQIIEPYYFGDRELKQTCLWLKKLPPLWYWKEDDLFGQRTATDYPEPARVCKNGRRLYFVDAQTPGEDRAARRSKTFPGIARAMAMQWSAIR